MEPDMQIMDVGHLRPPNDTIDNDNSISKMATKPPGEGCLSKFTSCRWQTGYLTLWCSLLLFAFRHSFNFAIVCMETGHVVDSNITDAYNTTITSVADSAKVVNPYIPDDVRGLVLSCYFYGYLWTPLIGGYLAARFGPKLMITVSMAVSMVVMVLLPISIRTNVYIAVAMRVAMGFASGVLLPSQQVLWSNWAPLSEKAQLAATSNSGVNVGSIMATAVSGFLCQIPFDEGWPLPFYAYAGVGVVWMVFWLLFVHDSPEQHPRCSNEEKQRIYFGKTSIKSSSKPLPWMKTLRSMPFWALVVNHVSHSWIMSSIQTFLPMYMSDVLKFDITSNGLLSSLPYIGRFFGGLFFAYIADLVLQKTSLSVTVNRKIFQTLGTYLPGGFLIGVSFLTSDQRMLAVGLMVLTMTTQACTMASFRVNHLDIAPRYAGQVMGFTLTIGSCAAIISPLIISAMTVDRTREQWQQVFFLTAGIVMTSDVFFLIFGSGKEQDWAKEDRTDVIPSVTSGSDGSPTGTTGVENRKKGTETSDEHSVHRQRSKETSELNALKNGVINAAFDLSGDLVDETSHSTESCHGGTANNHVDKQVTRL
ncbi:sialin-like [Haliotis rubra]|uniref:sialin-like n=1 Tax=Haliotis rubra TaxID=36100 RepID=UPI001EE61E81|nr:sialin-like [Haliotis rubra]